MLKAADGALHTAAVEPMCCRSCGPRSTKAGAGTVGVLSPFLTVEEAFLLGTWVKSLGGKLALGPVPVDGG